MRDYHSGTWHISRICRKVFFKQRGQARKGTSLLCPYSMLLSPSPRLPSSSNWDTTTTSTTTTDDSQLHCTKFNQLTSQQQQAHIGSDRIGKNQQSQQSQQGSPSTPVRQPFSEQFFQAHDSSKSPSSECSSSSLSSSGSAKSQPALVYDDIGLSPLGHSMVRPDSASDGIFKSPLADNASMSSSSLLPSVSLMGDVDDSCEPNYDPFVLQNVIDHHTGAHVLEEVSHLGYSDDDGLEDELIAEANLVCSDSSDIDIGGDRLAIPFSRGRSPKRSPSFRVHNSSSIITVYSADLGALNSPARLGRIQAMRRIDEDC